MAIAIRATLDLGPPESRHQLLLTELAIDFASVGGWDAFTALLAGKLKYLLDFDRLDLVQLVPHGRSYRIQTLFDPGSTARSLRGTVPRDRGPAGLCLELGRPCVVELGEREPSAAEADPSLECSSFRVVLALPLVVEDEPFGALLLASRIPDAFARADVVMGGKVGAAIAHAVRHLATVDELRRSNEELAEFAHVASHDLKAPARRMKGLAKLVDRSRDGLDEGARSALDLLVTNAGTLTQLIDDLLVYARLGRANGGFETVLTERVVNDALERLGKTDALDVTVEVGPLPNVWGRPSELTRLFQNLLENAIRYRASDREPVIGVRAEAAVAGWTFVVEDNGVGVDPKLAEAAFEPFRRLHAGDTDGSGIGLAACRKIVSAHGGEIWLEARPDGPGTRACFTLPGVCD